MFLKDVMRMRSLIMITYLVFTKLLSKRRLKNKKRIGISTVAKEKVSGRINFCFDKQ